MFFGQRAPGWGAIVSAGLGASAIGYVVAAKQTDGVAATLGIPLVTCVAFATLLAENIWRKNETAAEN
ncbi:tryptophan-rich sensory protein [Glacieibacterium megasporae]|uniref:tryptophan-rich sensory protein n=1 Tax=Glacieibacterium megasporae TaxID=2835787 RepID=UPI001C1E6D9E|nr:tryptophan-rich sensory protein [Polymorphobacter megasporae]UAJ10638.1 tryptophan-rich sensory protein [Polymorphobacter megasporae]